MTADPVVKPLHFTVEQFERMGETGVLDPDERYELLDGTVVPMSPIGPKHAGKNDRIFAVLVRRLFDRATVRGQNPVTLLPRSMPQPDIVVARHRRDFYESAHPTAEDVHLAVEVYDSSLRIDRLVKLPIYARQGVQEVWIVDIAAGEIGVHRDPHDGAYRLNDVVRGGESLAPVDFPDVVFTVEELLGPA